MKKSFANIRMLFAVIFSLMTGIADSQSPIYFFIDSSTIIGNILNNQVYVSETEIAYTIEGNIIFKGDSNAKEHILFAVNAKEILSNKVGLVYQDDMKTIQYLTQRGEFFFGDHPMEDYKKLLRIEVVNDSVFEVKSGIDGKLLGVIEGRFESQVQIVMAAYLYIRHYQLDEIISQQINSIGSPETDIEGVCYIRPYNNFGYYCVWQWDGEVLKPAYGYRPEDEWKFDGRYLQPVWSLDPLSEWEWDGKILKPTWDNSAKHQWVWDNEMLKPFWGSNPDLEWTFDGEVMRPMWNFDPNMQWVVEGNIPLPIIALVVLGKADR